MTYLLTYLIVILAAAKIGAEVFERLRQPAVLGELFAGVVLGNLVLVNHSLDFFEPLRAQVLTDHAAINLNMLAQLGIIILLFEVGLDSSIKDMRRVGRTSFLVATIGVAAPFILGYFVSTLFIRQVPEQIAAISPGFSIINIHIFIGAVLTATSVGITARVFKDIGKVNTQEARIVLGAAVFDDVLGLIILATVTAMVSSAEKGAAISAVGIARSAMIAVGFLVGALIVGTLMIPKLMRLAAKFRTRGLMLITALIICFGLAALAGAAGLAAIVGAFAAGLLLEEIHFKGFARKESQQVEPSASTTSEPGIKELISPISILLVPIFFVQMGIQVHIESFLVPSAIGISAGLIFAAVLGKQACELVVRKKEGDRLTVGIGMIPRGEVGLIFASIGRSSGIIGDSIFSAIVIMVMVTTFITPPLLKWSIGRAESRRKEQDEKEHK